MKWIFGIVIIFSIACINFCKGQSIQVNCVVNEPIQNDSLILKTTQEVAYTFMNARFGPQFKGVTITITTAASEFVNLCLYLNRHGYLQLVPQAKTAVTQVSGTCITLHEGKEKTIMYDALFEFLHAQLKR